MVRKPRAGPVEPPPTRRDSLALSHGPALKNRHTPQPQASTPRSRKIEISRQGQRCGLKERHRPSRPGRLTLSQRLIARLTTIPGMDSEFHELNLMQH